MAKVKVCGITNYVDAVNAVDLGADYLGFNFFKKSPRHIKSSKAAIIIKKLPKKVKTVGIFVNESIGKINNIVDICNIDIIQLSGDENMEFISDLKKSSNKKIIKTLRIGKKIFLEKIFSPIADYIMLDSYKKGVYGGTGTKFDWSIAKKLNKKRLFLSGGLNPVNVKQAIYEVNPYCVDVCSGVEKSYGKKDFKKMKEFIKITKKFNCKAVELFP